MSEGSLRPAALIEGSIPKALTSLALPMFVGIVFIMAVNLVDTYFVGQLGVDELGAMSFTFPVVTLVMSVGFGLSVGSTSAVARAIGAGDERAVRRLTTHALLLAVVVVTAVSGIGLLTQDWVFTALGAGPELLPLLDEYMTIWYLGAICLVVPMVANGVMRASGDAKTPAKFMAIAAATNAVLDPPLIFGFGPIPAMGITGAAIATVVSRLITLVAVLVMLSRMDLLDLHVPTWAELRRSWGSVLSVGVPATISNALTPVATAVLTGLVAVFGTAAVAGYGVASRIEGMILIPSFALTASLTPFIGQNWGGHHPERVREAMAIATRFVLVWGFGAWIVLMVAGEFIGGAFTDDPTVLEAIGAYVWLVPAGYGAHGIVSVVSSSFNAVDRAVRSTLLSAARSLGLAVPLAWLGSSFGDVRGIFAGIAIATILTGVLAMLWSRGLRKVPQADEQPARTLSGVDEGLAPLVATLVQQAEELSGLQLRPRPINTIGFYLAGHELGHVHRTGHIDLHVPPMVHDVLIEEGRAAHHRHVSGASWVTHRLESPADVDAAAWLLRLSMAIHHLACGDGSQDEVDAGMEGLQPSRALLAAACDTVERVRAARAS